MNNERNSLTSWHKIALVGLTCCQNQLIHVKKNSIYHFKIMKACLSGDK